METFASNMKMEIMKKDPPFGEESLKAGMYDDGGAWSTHNTQVVLTGHRGEACMSGLSK